MRGQLRRHGRHPGGRGGGSRAATGSRVQPPSRVREAPPAIPAPSGRPPRHRDGSGGRRRFLTGLLRPHRRLPGRFRRLRPASGRLDPASRRGLWRLLAGSRPVRVLALAPAPLAAFLAALQQPASRSAGSRLPAGPRAKLAPVPVARRTSCGTHPPNAPTPSDTAQTSGRLSKYPQRAPMFRALCLSHRPGRARAQRRLAGSVEKPPSEDREKARKKSPSISGCCRGIPDTWSDRYCGHPECPVL